MRKHFFILLLALLTFNQTYANVNYEIDEHIEDILRSRMQWDKIRSQVIFSSNLSDNEISILRSFKKDRQIFTEMTVNELVGNFNEGNIRFTVSELEKIDRQYLNYIKFNLPKDIYSELVIKRTAFKLSKGERFENSLRIDSEI